MFGVRRVSTAGKIQTLSEIKFTQKNSYLNFHIRTSANIRGVCCSASTAQTSGITNKVAPDYSPERRRTCSHVGWIKMKSETFTVAGGLPANFQPLQRRDWLWWTEISAGFSAEGRVCGPPPRCLAQSGSGWTDEKLRLARSSANCF